MAGRLKGHLNRSSGSPNAFRVEFFAYQDKSGIDVHLPECLLKPSGSARAWLALESATADAAAHDAFAKTEIGLWRFTCHWLAEPMELREYELRY